MLTEGNICAAGEVASPSPPGMLTRARAAPAPGGPGSPRLPASAQPGGPTSPPGPFPGRWLWQTLGASVGFGARRGLSVPRPGSEVSAKPLLRFRSGRGLLLQLQAVRGLLQRLGISSVSAC